MSRTELLTTARQALASYQHTHIVFASDPQPLRSLEGSNVGFVEEVSYNGHKVRVTGWSLVDNISLMTSSGHKRIRRRIHRGDVVTALGAIRMAETGNSDGRVGFSSEFSWDGGSIALCSEQINAKLYWPLPNPTSDQIRIARRSAAASFLRISLVSLPLIVSYFAAGRRKKHKEALRERLGLNVPKSRGRILSERFFLTEDSAVVRPQAITIIMPIYNAFELLSESLSRIDANTDLPYHLILIDDASPDERVRPWLKEWAAPRTSRVTLLENETNKGFIGSVNFGLRKASPLGRHVVLLNSDAFVPANWASRLLRPIQEDPLVASVTPMSNDATIFSVPSVTGPVQLRRGAVDEIDQVAQTVSGRAKVRVPSGVGFCMAISQEALKQVPELDTTFGRGYGEEVDWCQKARELGFIHVGIGNLFVEHRGCQSFGPEAKLKSMAEAGRVIASRYPRYDSDVQAFVQEDPLFTARLALSVAYAATLSSSSIHVYLAHSLGGGAQHWMDERIHSRELEGKPTVIIRVGGDHRFAIELHLAGDLITGETDSLDLVVQMLRSLPRRHIVYSCGVGDTEPLELPGMLRAISGDPRATLEVLFHDYLPISPSFNLLDSTGTYTGVPPEGSDDPAHAPILADGSRGSLLQWRSEWTRLIDDADQVTVFSESSRHIVQEAWPSAATKIQVRPHAITTSVPKLIPARSEYGKSVALGILGSIGDVKGARLVSQLAWNLERNSGGPRLVILGEFDRRFSLPESVPVTGRYQISSLPDLAGRYRLAAWWMPSICPETFSFTTHEMLATGLPVMAFDIGAQGDAVKSAPNGKIVAPNVAAVLEALDALLALKK